MTVTAITVSDMHCASCSAKISDALASFDAIERLQFNPVRQQVLVTHGEALSSSNLIMEIENAGFHPHLISESVASDRTDNALLKRLGIAGLAMMQVMMVQLALYAGAFQGMEESVRRFLELTALVFCIPVVCYSAVPFFTSALSQLRWDSVKFSVNMDTPIALAVLVAFSVSLVSTLRGDGNAYYDSVVMFTFLMLGARFLEQRVKRQLIVEDSLQAALPDQVTLVEGGTHRIIAATALSVADVVWVPEGARLPADGLLMSDNATLDESWLSGESEWRRHGRNAQLFAGTVNRGIGFELQVTAEPRHSRIAYIDELANIGMQSSHGFARLADQIARIFVPTILCLALLTYIGWSLVDPAIALSAALAVLVVSCPCALSLATPAALMAAVTHLRQQGVFVKNLAALESIQRLTQVWFDKTGTLTNPNTNVLRTKTLAGFSKEACLQMAGSLQVHSTHPLAQAFHRFFEEAAIAVVQCPGQGVQGQLGNRQLRVGTAEFCGMPEQLEKGDKQIWLSVDGIPAARFTVGSSTRTDSLKTINGLKMQDLSVQMISGDKDEHCARLAKTLDVSYMASVSPEQKTAALEIHNGGIMYVGDGVNDLPALAAATVSVATLETADLVKSKADVVLLSQRLYGLVDLVNTGRRCHRIIQQNMFWAAGYNLLAIPAAAFGFIAPWMAAVGMSASSILVMLNASRLLRKNTEVRT